MNAIREFAPAKLNLMLAITGRRADGFHELVSVVTPLRWGDTLDVEPAAEFTLQCDTPEVPTDGSNLVLRAAVAFRKATGWPGGAKFTLAKRIPVGAGLGGGSSNAAAALRALNRMAGEPMGPASLAQLAAELGSDCPLFLYSSAVVMRGRGERVEPLPSAAQSGLRGRRVLVFKPGFSISTVWAYRRMAATAPESYLPSAHAEARLAAWLGTLTDAGVEQPGPAARARPCAIDQLLFNNMEGPAFAKFPALPALLETLAARFTVRPRMSGSGSACFVLLEPDLPAEPLLEVIRSTWGPSAIAVETQLA